MPLNLDAADRRLLMGAGIVGALLIVAAVVFSSPGESERETPSSYSVSSSGAKAAYLMLLESGYQVERWENSPAELPDGFGKTLILAEPEGFLEPAQRAKLLAFVASGGRVIASGPRGAAMMPKNGSRFNPMSELDRKFQALAPSSLTRGAREIMLVPQSYWSGMEGVVPLYGDEDKVVAVEYGYGKGKVIWWASATPLTNSGIREADNLEFLLACVGDRHTQILWDEYFHGYRHSLADSVTYLQVKWLLAQLAIVAAAVLVTYSRRSGPVRMAAEKTRLSPLEFVETLGGLYQYAHASSVAVDVCHQRFRYLLARRLGVSVNLSAGELERIVRERFDLQAPDFARTLRACEAERFKQRMSASDALRLVRKLYEFAAELMLRGFSNEEITDASGDGTAEQGARRAR